MALKKAWKVSMQAILKRAEQLGKVSQVEADRLWRQIARAGYRRTEPIEIPREQPSLLREIVAMHVEDLGYSADDLSRTLHVPVDAFVRTYLWAARTEGPAPSAPASRRSAGSAPSDIAPETRLRLVK